MVPFLPSKERCQDWAGGFVARDLLFRTPYRAISSNTAFWRYWARNEMFPHVGVHARKRANFLREVHSRWLDSTRMITRRRTVNSEAFFALILTEKSRKWYRKNREKNGFFTFSVLELLPPGLYLRQSTRYRGTFFTVVLRTECSTNAVSFVEIWELFCMRSRDPVDTP